MPSLAAQRLGLKTLLSLPAPALRLMVSRADMDWRLGHYLGPG